VFKVAAFRRDASAKTSSPLLDCRVNHSLVKFVQCRHDGLAQLQDKGRTVKFIFEQTVCCIIRTRNAYFLYRDNVY